jgi:hypothetical protein
VALRSAAKPWILAAAGDLPRTVSQPTIGGSEGRRNGRQRGAAEMLDGEAKKPAA